MMLLHSDTSSSTFGAHPHHLNVFLNLTVGRPPGMKLSKRLDETEG